MWDYVDEMRWFAMDIYLDGSSLALFTASSNAHQTFPLLTTTPPILPIHTTHIIWNLKVMVLTRLTRKASIHIPSLLSRSKTGLNSRMHYTKLHNGTPNLTLFLPISFSLKHPTCNYTSPNLLLLTLFFATSSLSLQTPKKNTPQNL